MPIMIRKSGILLLLIFSIISCDFDLFGLFLSSDVDVRFADSRALVQLSDISPALPFSFLVITDTHIYNDNYQAQIASLVGELDGTECFMLVCGDLVQNGGRNDMLSFASFSTSLGIPVYAVPGNHDLFSNGWDHFPDILGPSSFSFSAGPVRIIGVDTANGTIGYPQRIWLETELQNRTEAYCVVFTHFQAFAPYISNTQQYTNTEELYFFMNLLETRNTDYLFMGHSHRNLELQINGTRYCNLGTYRSNYIRVTVTNTGISHAYHYY